MCRIPEDEPDEPDGRCCLFPIKDKLIRKLHYKRDLIYYPAVLIVGSCQLDMGYPEIILAENYHQKVLTYINNFRYADYEKVSFNIATEGVKVYATSHRIGKGLIDLGVKYLKEIIDSGWRPFYMVSYQGPLSIMDNTLHFNPLQVRLYVDHNKLKSGFIEAVTKYDKDGRFDGYHLLPLELWENIFQYYVPHAYHGGS